MNGDVARWGRWGREELEEKLRGSTEGRGNGFAAETGVRSDREGVTEEAVLAPATVG